MKISQTFNEMMIEKKSQYWGLNMFNLLAANSPVRVYVAQQILFPHPSTVCRRRSAVTLLGKYPIPAIETNYYYSHLSSVPSMGRI
jgi:hypothetical protein